MARSMQMMKMTVPNVGTYVVTYRENRRMLNQFVITLRSGGHETKVAAYHNYGSCLEYLKQIMLDTDNYWRENMPLTL